MKKLLLLTVLSISLASFSQEPNPDLYQTWYLLSYEYDLGDYFSINNINPPISPSITIEENLDFYGNAACNGYNGTFEYNQSTEKLILEDFLPSLLDCDYQSHTDFERDYFGFFSTDVQFEYIIDTDSNNPNNQSLILSPAPGFFLFYSNTQLSILENKIADYKIYPNPVSETLFITSENNSIDKISVYSINGQLVLSEKGNVSQIDISAFSDGLYFMEIASENGTSVQKFIKQ